MWRAELLDGGAGAGMSRDDRRRCERQVKEWMSGDLALLRHHQKDETAAEEEEKELAGRSGGRGGRGGRGSRSAACSQQATVPIQWTAT